MLPNVTDLFESLGNGSNFHYLLDGRTYFVTSKRINFVLISISNSCYKRALIFYHVFIIITCNFWEKPKKDIPENGYSWSHLKRNTCQSIVLFISVYKEFWSNERKKMKNIRASYLSMTGKEFCMTYSGFSQLIIRILNLLAKHKIFHCSVKTSLSQNSLFDSCRKEILSKTMG